jgi:thiamine biosynthesis protein ThiS
MHSRGALGTVRAAVNELTVTVNGERKTYAAGTTVADVVASMNLRGPVAVERNREIVPRANHPATELCDGDELEVVSFVGGG